MTVRRRQEQGLEVLKTKEFTFVSDCFQNFRNAVIDVFIQSLNNLEEIFEYYKYKVSTKIARKLVKKIVQATLQLQKSPQLGKKEELLTNRKFEYLFIITDNYKIIYWVEDNYIKIAAVFDCRQNPEKIKKI